jgi:hypothetical protein
MLICTEFALNRPQGCNCCNGHVTQVFKFWIPS